MKTKTTINLTNFAPIDNHETIQNLIDKFFYCQAYTDIVTRKTETQAKINKICIDINLLYDECERLTKGKEKKIFSSMDYSARLQDINDRLHGDGKKKGLLDRYDDLKTTLSNLEKDYDICITEILKWKNENGEEIPYEEEKTVEENVSMRVAIWENVIENLHKVDRYTIEVLTVLSYNMSVNDTRTNTIKNDLDTYYSVAVAHGYSVDGYKQCRPLADIKKRIQENLQSYLRSISIIYNEEGTSEGLFDPKVLNINATETMLFINTHFKGTKLDKNTGLEVGKYENKNGVTGQIINLALCKFQGLPYGKPADKK